MVKVNYPVSLIVVFLWIGFVCAISFMEAWLKFRAPGITLQLGLGIGRLVFNALNKVEWVFAFVVIANILLSKGRNISLDYILFFIPIIILIVQSIWLLPALDVRAEMILTNKSLPPSNLHYYFVIMEIIKVACLFIFGINLFKQKV